MKLLSMAAVLSVVLCDSGQAEPGPMTSWLMGEPLTLWDRGLDKLEDRVSQAIDREVLKIEDGYALGDVSYDWERDHIVRSVTIYVSVRSMGDRECSVPRFHGEFGVYHRSAERLRIPSRRKGIMWRRRC